MSNGTMKDAALSFAKMGLAVFPLVERDKVPAIAGGFTKATTDPEQIGAFWDYRPGCNVGIATGGLSRGLVVIDLDVKDGEDGVAELRAWEAAHGELPATATVVTGSGGMHLYYLANEPVGCSVNKDLGVDIRADGGYVVAPPSVHPNGRPYEFEEYLEDAPIAKADANVMAFIAHIQRKSEAAKTRFKLPEKIGKGERNDTLFRYASSMQSRGDDDCLILSALEAANKLRCNPPLPETDLMKIVNSVCRYGKGDGKPQVDSGSPGAVRKILVRTEKGGPVQSIDNIATVLANDAALMGRFYYDTRAYTRMVTVPLPWDPETAERQMRDSDYIGLACYLEREYGLMSKQKAMDAAVMVCEKNRRNLVAEWLDSLVWDGEERMDWLLPTFLGCDPSDYNVGVTRVLMYGAIARAYRPGTKFDYMPVLIGSQGIGKSMFVRRLCGSDSWYCDNLNTLEGDTAAEKLRGMWFVEMAELLAVKKQSAVEAVKAFITSMTDTLRPKYGRETEQRPRACVFVGTTNNPQFLTDTTGNRRFLPVECGKHEPSRSLFDAGAPAWFEQAWAEAVTKYKRDNPPLVLDSRLEEYAMGQQGRYLEDDPRVGIIQEYLDNRLEAYRQQHMDPDLSQVRVCAQEILDDALPDKYTKTGLRFLINEIHSIMRNQVTGWVAHPKGKARCGKHGVQRCYIPKEAGQ